MRFLPGEPALLMGKTLVIADTHLGTERDYRVAGYKFPSQTKELARKVLELVARIHAEKLLIVGDVKHKVPGTSFQEEREVPDFFSRVSKQLPVEIVPGNHDGMLAKLLPDIKIHPTSGVLIDDVYLCHGHSWPSPEFLNASFLVISHNHPLIELKDRLGFRWLEKVWIRAALEKKAIAEKYTAKLKGRLPELVVMPTFSDLVGGFAMNRTDKKPLGPVLKLAKLSGAKVFLLDGTFLGELKDLNAKARLTFSKRKQENSQD